MNQAQGRFGPLALMCVAALVGGGCLGSSVVGGPEDSGRGSDASQDVAADGAFDAPQTSDAASDALDAAASDAAPDGAVMADAGDAADAVPTCTTNAQCSDNEFGQNVCDTATGRCVGCVPADDTCPLGQHCDADTRACVAGCRTDDACAADPAGRRCDVARHACAECLSSDQCSTGAVCASGRCATRCDGATPCASGLACCRTCSSQAVDVPGSDGGCALAFMVSSP